MLFREIILHNHKRPLAERAKARKVVGPYRWTPAKPGTGRGFYQASGGGFRMGDGPLDLRIEAANRHLPHSRLSDTLGYFCDLYEGDALAPIIARLPRSRGFLAGWTMGAGMAACVDGTIYSDAEDAARAAHDLAERDAERSREEQAREDAEDADEDETEDE